MRQRPSWCAPISIGTLVAALVFAQPSAAEANEVGVDCGAGAGENLSARDIIINCGLSEEELQALVQSAVDQAVAQVRQEPDQGLKDLSRELAKDLGITEDAIGKFFEILGEQEVPSEELRETLVEIAERHQEALVRLAALNPEDPVTQGLLNQARAALKDGDYEQADQRLSEAELAEITAARQAQDLAQQANEIANRRFLNAASARAERGQAKLTLLRYLEAADHFATAAGIVPVSEDLERSAYLAQQADALYSHGYEKGDNDALGLAIDVFGQILNIRTRKRVPLHWAETQNNLGNALFTLGSRESGTGRLDLAVSAYQAALEEWTRERVPLEWAKVQNNLGNALWILSSRKNDSTKLDQAVSAYRAALEEWTRDRAPLNWAMTQNNLGNALLHLGKHERAVDAYRAALEERTRERVPQGWARTQMNLGTALVILGERDGSKEKLDKAVDAFQAALKEYTRQDVPLNWAAAQINLGGALQALGERESGTERFEQAVQAYHNALTELSPERAIHHWAAAQTNLGITLQALGERTGEKAHLEAALLAMRNAHDATVNQPQREQYFNDQIEKIEAAIAAKEAGE